MAEALLDIRIGIRGFRRTPGFALTAILTLAVGIGIATAVFTVAEALLLRPLPVRDQNRVVVLWGAASDGRVENFPLLLPEARDFAARVRSLEQIEFFGSGGASRVPVRDGGSVFRLRRALVSGGYSSSSGAARARPGLAPGRRRRGRRACDRAEPMARGSATTAVTRAWWADSSSCTRPAWRTRSSASCRWGWTIRRGVDFWAPVLPNSSRWGTLRIRGAQHSRPSSSRRSAAVARAE